MPERCAHHWLYFVLLLIKVKAEGSQTVLNTELKLGAHTHTHSMHTPYAQVTRSGDAASKLFIAVL